jgi:hypothetical protein
MTKYSTGKLTLLERMRAAPTSEPQSLLLGLQSQSLGLDTSQGARPATGKVIDVEIAAIYSIVTHVYSAALTVRRT